MTRLSSYFRSNNARTSNRIFDPTTSQKFLHTFLESGGAVEPLDLFIEFRGRSPQVEALLRQSGII